jgi:hypothetical protein
MSIVMAQTQKLSVLFGKLARGLYRLIKAAHGADTEIIQAVVTVGQCNFECVTSSASQTQPNRETRLVRVKIRRAKFIQIFLHIFY